MENNVIQNYYLFKADGLNDKLSAEEKEKVIEINNTLEELDSRIKKLSEDIDKALNKKFVSFRTIKGELYARKKYSFDIDYSLNQKQKIFTHGKSNYKIWFLNKKHKLCVINEAKIVNNNIYLDVSIDVKGYNKSTRLTLDRFLYLVQAEEFKITNKKFIKTYLKPYDEAEYFKKLNAEIAELSKRKKEIIQSNEYKKFNKMYQEMKKSTKNDIKELKANETRLVPPSPALMHKKEKTIKNKVLDVKTIWNSTVTDAEKAYMMGWLSRHVVNMKIKVIAGGVSDAVISKGYPEDIYGSKYREKANSSGWDAASATILVDSVEYAPIETIKKLSTLKHLQRSADKGETVFKGHTIHNLDLVLFLLSKYNKYGFKTGEKLNIDFKGLVENEFPNNYTEFMNGFIYEF